MYSDSALEILRWLVGIFGYRNVVMVKDVILGIAFTSVGVIITMILLSRVTHKIRTVDNIGKMTSLSFEHAGKEHIMTKHNKTFIQQLEFTAFLLFAPSWLEYNKDNRRRTLIVTTIILLLMVILIIFAFYLILHPLVGIGLSQIPRNGHGR